MACMVVAQMYVGALLSASFTALIGILVARITLGPAYLLVVSLVAVERLVVGVFRVHAFKHALVVFNTRPVALTVSRSASLAATAASASLTVSAAASFAVAAEVTVVVVVVAAAVTVAATVVVPVPTPLVVLVLVPLSVLVSLTLVARRSKLAGIRWIIGMEVLEIGVVEQDDLVVLVEAVFEGACRPNQQQRSQ